MQLRFHLVENIHKISFDYALELSFHRNEYTFILLLPSLQTSTRQVQGKEMRFSFNSDFNNLVKRTLECQV